MYSKHQFLDNTFNIVLLISIASLISGFSSTSYASENTSTANTLPKCLYVSSYHKGYDWSDGVEAGVRTVLEGKCEIRQFDMDTKRKKNTDDKIAAAKQVYEIIQTWKPDIVLTSDDNAAKFVIVPYNQKLDVPFVFSGVNWTVEEYGFPLPNVTGIVEVAPIEPMLKKAMDFTGGSSAIYLGADTLTEGKNFQRIESGAKKLGISVDKILVSTFDEWLVRFNVAQSADFIVMGSNSGISGWSDELAEAHVKKHARKLSVSNHAWMMNVTSLGFTKIPEEHGEWAAEASLAILAGTSVSDIPIMTNRKWELWLNNTLVDMLPITLPTNFSRKAKRIASID